MHMYIYESIRVIWFLSLLLVCQNLLKNLLVQNQIGFVLSTFTLSHDSTDQLSRSRK